jgi:hypothetical protein
MSKTIEHYWAQDPDIASAVKGDTERGGLGTLRTMDLAVMDLLGLILLELRKMNMHLSALSGQEILNDDIEGIDR